MHKLLNVLPLTSNYVSSDLIWAMVILILISFQSYIFKKYKSIQKSDALIGTIMVNIAKTCIKNKEFNVYQMDKTLLSDLKNVFNKNAAAYLQLSLFY